MGMVDGLRLASPAVTIGAMRVGSDAGEACRYLDEGLRPWTRRGVERLRRIGQSSRTTAGMPRILRPQGLIHLPLMWAAGGGPHLAVRPRYAWRT